MVTLNCPCYATWFTHWTAYVLCSWHLCITIEPDKVTLIPFIVWLATEKRSWYDDGIWVDNCLPMEILLITELKFRARAMKKIIRSHRHYWLSLYMTSRSIKSLIIYFIPIATLVCHDIWGILITILQEIKIKNQRPLMHMIRLLVNTRIILTQLRLKWKMRNFGVSMIISLYTRNDTIINAPKTILVAQ